MSSQNWQFLTPSPLSVVFLLCKIGNFWSPPPSPLLRRHSLWKAPLCNCWKTSWKVIPIDAMGPNKKEDFLNWKLWHEKGPTTIQKKTFFQNLEEKKNQFHFTPPSASKLGYYSKLCLSSIFCRAGYIDDRTTYFVSECKLLTYLLITQL